MTDDCCTQISNWSHGECARCGNHCMPRSLWEKPWTLAENVADAKKTVASWSSEKKQSVQLEGQWPIAKSRRENPRG